MKTINFVGCGRVGQTLGTLWHRQGLVQLQDVLTQSAASAQSACLAMGQGTAVTQLQDMRPADLWLIGVQDAHIADIAHAMATSLGSWQGRCVFHCSGAQSSALLQPLQAQGAHTASAHCILSFASVDAAVRQFPGTVCALEGEAAATQVLQPLLTGIGARCFALQAQHKLLYHAAAVFATNFAPVLSALADSAWRDSGMPEAWITTLRNTLLGNAVENIRNLGPQGALTGPAARGDRTAIARQSQALRAWDPQAAQAYDALSDLALRLANTAKETTAHSASQR